MSRPPSRRCCAWLSSGSLSLRGRPRSPRGPPSRCRPLGSAGRRAWVRAHTDASPVRCSCPSRSGRSDCDRRPGCRRSAVPRPPSRPDRHAALSHTVRTPGRSDPANLPEVACSRRLPAPDRLPAHLRVARLDSQQPSPAERRGHRLTEGPGPRARWAATCHSTNSSGVSVRPPADDAAKLQPPQILESRRGRHLQRSDSV